MNLFIGITFAAIMVTILLTRSKVEEEYKSQENDFYFVRSIFINIFTKNKN